jgi:hypothetical protein
MLGRDIAADGTTQSWIARRAGRQRHHQNLTRHLGHHQPVRGRLRRIEQRFTAPDLRDVVQAEVGMFEQVTQLTVDLEGPVLVEDRLRSAASGGGQITSRELLDQLMKIIPGTHDPAPRPPGHDANPTSIRDRTNRIASAHRDYRS